MQKVFLIVCVCVLSELVAQKATEVQPVLDDVLMNNVEALADSELFPGEYDIIEKKTVFSVDDETYKETKVVRCEWGGKYACQEGNYWRHKINGIWTDWFYG